MNDTRWKEGNSMVKREVNIVSEILELWVKSEPGGEDCLKS